jgi:hypothetical protein
MCRLTLFLQFLFNTLPGSSAAKQLSRQGIKFAKTVPKQRGPFFRKMQESSSMNSHILKLPFQYMGRSGIFYHISEISGTDRATRGHHGEKG